ncbi:hypothetical protein PAPHI01_1768 [Pancytospora philotis]|nr:hypothetical protein PAPHI01_1768 [Pancytospora philotis]
MPSAEQILTGLLEYGKIQQPDAYKMMAAVLGLEFYSEEDSAPPIYTICSDTFVLDITPSSCNLMFVEESKGAEFASIQRYLDYYLQNKLVFYRLLKFFVSVVRLESGADVSFPQDAASGPADLRQYKSICRCVLDGDYCFRSKISTIPAGYNIFTHRFERAPINSPLSGLKDGAPPDDCASIEQPVNLYDYFSTADFSAKVFSRWAGRYECYYEGDGVRVSRGDVFLDGTKCRLASFAFKKGCSLRDALDVSSKIKQCEYSCFIFLLLIGFAK